MNKIQRVSLFFKWVFQIAFLGLIAIQIITWVYAPDSLYTARDHGFNLIPEAYFMKAQFLPPTFTLVTKSLCFLISMIPTSIYLIMLYFLIKLFALYQRGDIFTAMNVRCIRNVGLAVLASELVNPVYQALLGFAISYQNFPGHRFAMFGISTTNLALLLMSILIILISWVMAEGCRLREEQQLTI